MPTEKIYYAAVILLSAVSILLSPFFYVRRSRTALTVRPPTRRQWYWVLAVNTVLCAVLLAAWYLWF
ncbi:hypothetical protein ACG2K1_07365 [Neisseria sp. 23W00296]|uniref:hypothetical protein n=1 Tax=unclassified Neisseria TaxID=2623750 RepID=UPI0002A3A1F6|nr:MULTISPECIES: hypothetical protein [unclassified Neisseria]ASP17429.1 hypothetical protein CGZ77_06535 [Neisseria sp. KEM232]EKY06887.1 hypothetical protein HMPREF9120_01236 [Neisseria sp. oral taxon 020 str. F0370]